MAFEVGAPHRTVPHLLADLIELMLVSRHEGYVTLSPATIQSIVSGAPIPDDEVEEVEAVEANKVLNDAEKSDKRSVYMEDAWRQLRYRANRFDDSYPFLVGENGLSAHPAMTPGMRIYRFLLACSRLRSFPPALRVAWAKMFARLSAHALKMMIPPAFEVRIFDANSDDRQNYYGTDFRNALLKLAEDLHVEPHKLTCSAQSSSGDGGIDIVGMYPFRDAAASTVAILGQCAAQETEWPKKRFEGSPASVRGYFHLLSDPLHVTFIPMCVRQGSGAWVNEAHTSGTVVVDRVRFMALLARDANIEQLVQQQWFLDFENQLAAL